MMRLKTLSGTLVLIFVLGSLSLVACDDEEDAEEEADEAEVVAEVEEEEVDEVEEEAEAELPEADSSFSYRPFRPDEDLVEQEGHAMAFVDHDGDDVTGFRVLIVPTQVEFICGDPNMRQRGDYEEGEESLSLSAAEDFELEVGEHPIEFINVGNTGVDSDQDLRFDLQEISDDEIVGAVVHHGEEDEEPRISAEFSAERCDS